MVSAVNPGNLVRFQLYGRTESVEVAPSCLEPVYTADAIYWLNHFLATTGGEEPAPAHLISFCREVSTVRKLKGLETKRELTVRENKKTEACIYRVPSFSLCICPISSPGK